MKFLIVLNIFLMCSAFAQSADKEKASQKLPESVLEEKSEDLIQRISRVTKDKLLEMQKQEEVDDSEYTESKK